MARVDDYINAKKIAAEKLSKKSFKDVCQRSGFEPVNENTIRAPFLDNVYQITFPAFEFRIESQENDTEIPLQEQVLILHYMLGEGPSNLSGHWVSYREIRGASFYYSAFIKRAVDPLKKVFGQNISGFKQAADRLCGIAIESGDAAFEFRIFPRVPLQLILWEGDDEFPAEASILFDETVGKILLPEDIAWLAGMPVYRLIALSR
ncbi:MAG: DUF3786 domain-containing protein [Deltaproteobacteria bacterium]|nr:DUF3786 domain-containing protein [Deltaproteobacteria bacterium]